MSDDQSERYHCAACDIDNPCPSRFCGQCGAPVTAAQAATATDDQLISQIAQSLVGNVERPPALLTQRPSSVLMAQLITEKKKEATQRTDMQLVAIIRQSGRSLSSKMRYIMAEDADAKRLAHFMASQHRAEVFEAYREIVGYARMFAAMTEQARRSMAALIFSTFVEDGGERQVTLERATVDRLRAVLKVAPTLRMFDGVQEEVSVFLWASLKEYACHVEESIRKQQQQQKEEEEEEEEAAVLLQEITKKEDDAKKPTQRRIVRARSSSTLMQTIKKKVSGRLSVDSTHSAFPGINQRESIAECGSCGHPSELHLFMKCDVCRKQTCPHCTTKRGPELNNKTACQLCFFNAPVDSAATATQTNSKRKQQQQHNRAAETEAFPGIQAKGVIMECPSCGHSAPLTSFINCKMCKKKTCNKCTVERAEFSGKSACQLCYFNAEFARQDLDCPSCGKTSPISDCSKCRQCKKLVCCADFTMEGGKRSRSRVCQLCLALAPVNNESSGKPTGNNTPSPTRKWRDSLSKRALSKRSSRTFVDGKFPSRGSGDVFGMILEGLPAVPEVLVSCCAHVEKYGRTEEGIFRLASHPDLVQTIRRRFTAKQYELTEGDDVHAVASVMKQWFRELQPPLFPERLYRAACACIDAEVTLPALRRALPKMHWAVFEYLMKFLYRMSTHVLDTKMDIANIATVWSPNILFTPDEFQSATDILQAAKTETQFVVFCIRAVGAPPASPAEEIADSQG